MVLVPISHGHDATGIIDRLKVKFWHQEIPDGTGVFLTKSQMGIELRLFASATLYVSNFTNKSNKSGAVTFTNLICTQHETRVMSVQRNLPKRLDNV